MPPHMDPAEAPKQPVVTTRKSVTFTASMLIEALNSAYPGINIGAAGQMEATFKPGVPATLKFEWDE